MVYLTGDTHIPIDLSKLNTKRFPAQKNLTKDDFLIICGDFGGVWDRGKEELYWQKWLDDKKFTTLFVDGNHENFELLDSFELVDFCGGKAHKISNSIYHLMRGQVYTIDGKTFFTFGGGESHDKAFRTEKINWWKEELPGPLELEGARLNLEAVGWTVDYVVSHCAPSFVQREFSLTYRENVLTDFFEDLAGKLQFKEWFFGHYHKDATVFGKYICLFEDIKQL